MSSLTGSEGEGEKTPITIITGFLGSGKTTLVNYILREQTQWKICVVENEFGEVAIDDGLVGENLAAKEDIITMDNGCVCCSIRGDLVRTFGMLVARRKDFHAIILETTGVADPSPIIFTFNTNALLQMHFRIDSVVCLVDSKHIGIHLDEKKPDGNINEAENQIAFADRIVLNKVDLVSKEELEEVEDRIRSMNSFAKLIKTERSRAPLDQILGLDSFSLDKLVEMDPTFMDPEEDDEHDHDGHVHDEHCGHHVHDEHCGHHVHDEHCGHEAGHDHGHGHGHEHHEAHDHHGHHEHEHGHHDHKEHDHHDHKEHDHHDHAHSSEKPTKKKKKTHNLSLVTSVGFTIEGLLDVVTFNTFMTNLLQAKAADIYRSKGILAFADQGDIKFVFQGVHDQINFGPSEKPWGADEPRVSKVVFIGKNLDSDYLMESLRGCTTDQATAKITMHKRT
jgi:G3E family GTPase